MPKISDATILMIATDGFEESELFGPREILLSRGARVTLASPDLKPIQATVHDDPGKTIRPDIAIEEARAEDFDALIVPGGVRNPDQLRTNQSAVELVRTFNDQSKPVAAICHGPWLLVEANILRGRTATSWPSIRTDLTNAGAQVIDEAAVTDGNLVTSRKPDDVPEFTEALIRLIEKAPQREGSRQPSELTA
jgi:protease I